jgi:hypothetical protein
MVSNHTRHRSLTAVHVVHHSLAPQTVVYGAGLTGIRVFDPTTETHVTRSVTMAQGRWYPSVLQTADNKVLIIGGVINAGNRFAGVKDIEIYDPTNATASPMPRYTLPSSYLRSFNGSRPFYPLAWGLPTGWWLSIGWCMLGWCMFRWLAIKRALA